MVVVRSSDFKERECFGVVVVFLESRVSCVRVGFVMSCGGFVF